jgi:hypothetical protein
MDGTKIFANFMLFISVFVIPMALIYLMLTGKMNNLSPTEVAVIEIYLAMVCVMLLLMIVNWFIKL